MKLLIEPTFFLVLLKEIFKVRASYDFFFQNSHYLVNSEIIFWKNQQNLEDKQGNYNTFHNQPFGNLSEWYPTFLSPMWKKKHLNSKCMLSWIKLKQKAGFNHIACLNYSQ